MSEQALIDGLKFAREEGRIAGELAVADMPRLHDSVYEPAGRVHYSLAGSIDRRGRPVLEITLEGAIPLVCQRCLERVDYELERRSRLVLVESSGELPDVAQENPDSETIAAADVASVPDLIEQEILLALPLAPVHDGPCAAVAQSDPKIDSPFEVLRTLKRS